MKSTDLIQPLPMVSPIANQGAKFDIPQNPTSAGLASVVEGFPEITMQSLKTGGLPPRGQDANGMFYLSTDQRVFLQNGGVITFSQEVSDLIGGYPKNAVLDYIDENDVYCKVQSLVDDNTNNFVENPSLIDDTNWKKVKFGGSGSGLKIGTAFFSQGFVDTSKGLEIEANGQVVQASSLPAGFVSWVDTSDSLNTDFSTTEQNWQAEAALNPEGICGKYVVNRENDEVVSVRLPKYPEWAVQSYDFTTNGGTVPVVGNGVLGLTNGATNGGLSMIVHNSAYDFYSSQFTYGKPVGNYNNTTMFNNRVETSSGFGITTDPTQSGLVAQLGSISSSSTKIKGKWYIQIATGQETEVIVKNEIEALPDAILFEPKYSATPLYDAGFILGGSTKTKAEYPDGYNALLIELNPDVAVGTTVDITDTFSYTKRGLDVKETGASDITEYAWTVNKTDESFTAPLLDGSEMLPDINRQTSEVIATGAAITNSGTYTAKQNGWVTINSNSALDGVIIKSTSGKYGNSGTGLTAIEPTATIFLLKGQTARYSYHKYKDAIITLEFTPAKGNGDLYFCIATVGQNAALANLGRMSEEISRVAQKMSPDYTGGTMLDLTVNKVQLVEEDSYFFAYAYRTGTMVSTLRMIVCTADGTSIKPIFEFNLQVNGFMTSWSNLIKKGTYIKVAENTAAQNYIMRYPATGGIS